MKLDLVDFRHLDAFDILLLAIFIIYIVFPVDTPNFLVPIIESPIGLVLLFAIAVSLFVYKTPILGVLFIFVAYELLRRNHYVKPASPIIESTKYMANRVPTEIPTTQKQKNTDLKHMNAPVEKTLEEEVIEKESPVGKSNLPAYVESAFQPVADRSNLGMTLV